MDAGHLKGEWKGVMLVATCKDANNTLVQVATVVCDKENADNYTWLYKMMKKNAEMKVLLDSPKTTIFTDQHLSHAPAINYEAGNCQWRFCLRHIISNLTQKVGEVSDSSSFLSPGWSVYVPPSPFPGNSVTSLVFDGGISDRVIRRMQQQP